MKKITQLPIQIRRASRSVGDQLSEAWGKRRYEKVFINKLVDADGEQHEVQHWALVARDWTYIDEDTARRIIEQCREIGRLLNGMINKSDKFCHSNPTRNFKEPGPEYFISEIEAKEFNQTDH